jgi:CopG family nickel-responsive transcriptional regulator
MVRKWQELPHLAYRSRILCSPVSINFFQQKGYQNRSEAIRDLMRDRLVKQEWESNRETMGTITIVYGHHTRELSKVLTNLQHEFFRAIISTLHVHLDQHNCLEVLVVKGKGIELKK